VWRPQFGPQKALVDCPLSEVFFGGARGGGKTDGVLGKWALKEKRYGRAFNAIMFRRTTVSSEDAIERSREIYEPLGAKFNGTKLQWRMPNGGRVSFAYLDTVSDADEYQGRNVSDAWVEEAGQFPDPAPIDRLYGVLRSKDGVPIQLILTANPGGAGQHWIAKRYGLIPFPAGPKVVERILPNKAVHRMAVIPSRISDNKIMLRADPEYENRLQMVGAPELVRAWLEGDWSAIEGAYFPEWSEAKHVVTPFQIPDYWTRICGFDWGSASPFSVGWWAVAGDDFKADGLAGQSITIPRGALVRYREWYGANDANKGLKLTVEEVAAGIKQRETQGEKISARVADPSILSEDGGPSRAERMGASHGIWWQPGDNRRVAKQGAAGGWDQVRARLKGQDGQPMLYVFSTCRDFIRTVPVLQHDPMRPEDLDTKSEDHIADETRYVCMSRPWTAPQPDTAQRPRDYGMNRKSQNGWKTT